MGLSILVVGTALTVLPMVAAGLLAAMVLLERDDERLAAVPANAGRGTCRLRCRHRKPGRARRG